MTTAIIYWLSAVYQEPTLYLGNLPKVPQPTWLRPEFSHRTESIHYS